MRSTGTTITTTTLGEAVRPFVPHPLPPASPPLAADSYSAANRRAEMALARLAGVAGLVPSVDWLLYSAIRKEALFTSQIEGTQATLTDLFDDEAGQVLANTADVEEVTNYLRAFRLVRDNLRSEAGLPISVRLLCDAHRLLLDGARGAGKQPGELRRSQNWIGGARPGRATFVPPPPDQLPGLLADLERFIHDPAPALPPLPPLVRVALVHVQFETIHPFLDGNGRIGRLLIAALLEQWGLLPEPLVCLSGYLKQASSMTEDQLEQASGRGGLAGRRAGWTPPSPRPRAELLALSWRQTAAQPWRAQLADYRRGATGPTCWMATPPARQLPRCCGRLRSAVASLNPACPRRRARMPSARCWTWARRCCWPPTGSSTGCWWAACRCSTSRTAKRAATSCAGRLGRPARNEWLAVNQFSITGPHHTRRPDIILFVNGLPLVLIELKNPADLNADVWKAFHQIQTYKAQIPDVFQYNEVLVISDGSEALLGSLSADSERFMAWRTIDGVTLDPLGKFNELQTLVRGVLAPAYLLDYLRFFVLFEDDGGLVKKIAGYHQFHAVRAAIARWCRVATRRRCRLRGKGGVVWHTQGSGKSITMTCFAARVMQEPAMENPTIVVITDRNDLDGQLFGVFSLAQDLLREQPVQANTRQELRALLGNRPSGGIVFATIQKFMPGEDEDTFPLLSDRHNIVVIADEAHRTQYGFEAKLKTLKHGPAGRGERADHRRWQPPEHQAGIRADRDRYQVGYAQHLRDALPNATFVAFTGTPVSGEDRDTRAVFGDYISVYDMQQAKEDGATVAIYYESRLAKLG
jgi:Fic family protein